jgi:hypothetical protein
MNIKVSKLYKKVEILYRINLCLCVLRAHLNKRASISVCYAFLDTSSLGSGINYILAYGKLRTRKLQRDYVKICVSK